MAGWILAQLLKVPVEYFRHKDWDWSLLANAGGMPSSHSALMTSVTTAIGFYVGWDSPLFVLALAITGMHRERVKYLLDSQLSLYAAHIPLDAHREVGNNWGLAPILGLKELEPFGEFRGQPIGVKGVFPEAVPIRQLASDIEKQLGEQVMVHAGGPDPVSSLGIVSGGAAWDVVTAAEQGLDAFLTGEPKHEVFHHPYEMGINAIYAGHYMTETVGVTLLASKLEDQFGLSTEFILLPTGL